MLGTILLIILIGVLLYLVNTYIPMAQWVKTVVNVLGMIFVGLLCWSVALAIIGPVDLQPLPLHR